MTTATAIPQTLDERVWRMSIDRYHAMVSAGVLLADDPIELLEGVLVEKTSRNAPHVYCVKAISRFLTERIPAGWHATTQDPVTLADSEPEPDVAVVRGDGSEYLSRHPQPGEIGLVVEVADSSLNRDRGIKKRIYAGAGIPTYWLVDLNARRIEVYSEPEGSDYAAQCVLSEGEEVSLGLPGEALTVIAVSKMLPPLK